MVAAYDLGAAVSRPRILVARSMPITNTPVAIGSRVPAWPTRRVAKMRRHRPTTSWLVIPAGLSITTIPGPVALIARSRSAPVRAQPTSVPAALSAADPTGWTRR
ncbi:Uncharacterised protein [Mycobacterium tuberculosis]|uniref:Uncharacterized protein n=1 Tax=Mycobacterium tuberculosis TaxID=1773 RepID=A0A654T4T9_MYCTX|nr:Uncharacterised protein [Mycobacterium tuberculosis]COX19562.1 Uncharacterised protein [Mycobacterium tuberculosis]